jgi:hypothetical protein
MKERIVTEALPGFNTGLKTIVYTAYQHYCLGMSISKILKTLKIHGLTLTEGALVGSWHALADIFKPFYSEIHAKIRGSTEAVYADETGFRQKGKKFWLWMFATKEEAFFAIRKSRGGDVVREILGDVFNGILVTDFWKPYLAVKAILRQWCVAHFLREFKKIEFRRKDLPGDYYSFKKVVRRLFNDALRESKDKDNTDEKCIKAHKRFLKRLDLIASGAYTDPDILRLIKRLKKYRDGFFTFVVNDVDATNNYAERIIRFAVILRKISFHTMSAKGSETMSILMSVFKTRELLGENVFDDTLQLAKNAIIAKKSKRINITDLSA